MNTIPFVQKLASVLIIMSSLLLIPGAFAESSIIITVDQQETGNTSIQGDTVRAKLHESLSFTASRANLPAGADLEWQVEQADAVLECGNPHQTKWNCLVLKPGIAIVFIRAKLQYSTLESNRINIQVEKPLTSASIKAQVDDPQTGYQSAEPPPYQRGKIFTVSAKLFGLPEEWTHEWKEASDFPQTLECKEELPTLLRCNALQAGSTNITYIIRTPHGQETYSNTITVTVKSPNPQFTISSGGTRGPQQKQVGEIITFISEPGLPLILQKTTWITMNDGVLQNCSKTEKEMSCFVAAGGKTEIKAYFDTSSGRFSSNGIVVNVSQPLSQSPKELEATESNGPPESRGDKLAPSIKLRSNKPLDAMLHLRPGELFYLRANLRMSPVQRISADIRLGWSGYNASDILTCREQGDRLFCRAKSTGELSAVRYAGSVNGSPVKSADIRIRVSPSPTR